MVNKEAYIAVTLSAWYRNGDRRLMERLVDPDADLTQEDERGRTGEDILISVSAYVRERYLEALRVEYGTEEAERILTLESKTAHGLKLTSQGES